MQQALTGAMGIIRRCRPMIIVDTVPEDRWLSNDLRSLEYQISGNVHDDTILKCS